MNLNEDYNVASRYRTIRKHLDSLSYRQSLPLDALPLVEKLLADLIQTTDSLKHFKTIAQDNVEACSQLQLSIDPYKCDNARLVQECNQLHLDLIEAKEAHQKQAKDLKRKIYHSESECNNLQLASSRNLKRIKDLEAESAQKSKKIQELLGKCCKPLISNASLASKKRSSYPLRRPSLESEPLPRTKGHSSLPSLSKVEPKVVDLLAMADRKMNSLNHEVTTLKGELSMQVDNVHTLKVQLANKEKEISRLKKMLEGGRPHTAVSKDFSCKKKDQFNEHNGFEKASDHHSVCHKGSEMNDLRVLQQAKVDLEQQLREALEKQHEAMSQAMKLAERNEELEKELRDIDHIALAVEADCNSTVKENNKRVSHLQEKLQSAMTQIHVLEGELMMERRSGQELRADLEAERLENRNLQRKLESTLEEKKQMTDRINELTVIEQNLNQEIQRLSRDVGNLRIEVARLDCANDLLKKQLHSNVISQNVKEGEKSVQEKGEKNDKNKGKALMKKKRPASKGQRRSFSPPVHEKQSETIRRHGDTKDDEVTRDSNIEATRRNSQKLNDDKDSKISQLQSTINQIQTDRDYYKNEYNRLREQSTKNSEADSAELWGQVCELRRQLIEKERLVLDLQREKKDLCREKFELELRLQSSRSERRNTCHPCGQCRPIGNCACLTASPGGEFKAMLERLERERDAARADVDRLVEERDAMRERLKLAVEAHKFEQRRLRQNLCEVESRLSQLERERQGILLAQGTQRAAIGGFEDQLEDLREELRRTKQELTTQRTQYFQLRTLQDQADQALGDVQSQLAQTEAELYKSMDRNRNLDQQRLQLDNEVKELKQEINTIRGNVSRRDQEKDQILAQLDERNEKIAFLERELKIKEQEAAAIEQRYEELQQKYQLCVDQSAEQERRLRNMQMEMEIHQRQLAAASNDRDNAAQENRRLQDDLAAVTCEIRTLQRELEVSRAESYDLKRQLQTYVSEVRRAEELINRKENERTEMLNHFRSLSLEATMLENNNHSLESEAAEARSALQSARDRSLDLERQLTDKDCMIRGYETQITELTHTVASLETQVRQQMEQRQRAEADLNAVRDLCVKLDQQKETLVKELGDKDAMKAQYEAQLARLKAEQNMVQDQINRDHVTVERLGTLLDQARQESMDSQAANQELQCEMSRLKQRMCELQTKLSSESAELRRYQNQAAEYSKQISELRRQVTNERFDRARKDEEHRRSCHENCSGETSQSNTQTRRVDYSTVNVQNGSSSRFPQSGLTEEYRSRDDLRIEAQRTNRFGTSNSRNVSALTISKHTDNDGKMYNDTKLSREVYDIPHRAHVTLNPDISTGQTSREVEKASRTEETLRLEEALEAGTVNYGGLRVRTSVEEDNEHRDIRVRISDQSSCTFCEAERNTSSAVKFRKPLVCEGSSEQDLSTNEAAMSSEDRNRPRQTTESSVQFCQDLATLSSDEFTKNDNTLKRLHELLGDASETRKTRERSISLPRAQSTLRQNESVRSNVSFPICVDYSQAKITAADLTRPEFVQMLTELKERTRSVEEKLSRMNNAMRCTNLRGNSPDVAGMERERTKMRKSHEKTDEPEASTSGVAKTGTGADSGTVGTSEKEKKTWRKKKKSKNASSQVELEDSTSKPITSTTMGLEYTSKKEENSGAQTEIMGMKLQSCYCENIPDHGLRISNNRVAVVGTKNLPSIGTQSSVDQDSKFPDPGSTVNEASSVKPSRIHKLKKQVFGKSSGNEKSFDDPRNSTDKNNERFAFCGLSKSPLRLGSSSPDPSARSMIPKLQGKPERLRSSSTQSRENREAALTSLDDFHPFAPPTTPNDNEGDPGYQRGRQPSRFSLKRPLSHSPSKNRKTSLETRSRSVDSNRNAPIDDSVGTENIDTDESKKSSTLEVIGFGIARAVPESLNSKIIQKQTGLGNQTNNRTVTGQPEIPCANKNCESSSRISTRSYERARQNSFQRVNNPRDNFNERRTSGIESRRERNLTEDGQRISKSSGARKLGSSDKLSLANYPSNANRLEHVGTVKFCYDAHEKVDDSSIANNKTMPKIQQRSRSAPRDSRNYGERSSG